MPRRKTLREKIEGRIARDAYRSALNMHAATVAASKTTRLVPGIIDARNVV